jgi:hypothetical protein
VEILDLGELTEFLIPVLLRLCFVWGKSPSARGLKIVL